MLVNYCGKPVGSRGDVSVFSTYVAHIISTGVGGIITTNDLDLATRMKSLIFHGRDNIYLSIEDGRTENPVKLNSLVERRFQFIHLGYSLRLTELETAIGVAELARRKQIVKRRRQVGLKMTQALSEFMGHFQLPAVRPESEHIYMLYPILIKNPKIDRHDLLMYLEKRGIETRLFFPLLSQPVYIKLFGDIEYRYPVAQHVVKNGFIIGSHESYSSDDILYVADVIREYLKEKRIL
jgi:dTDP-4-amino-4,6-dideoxygalactose transaminase